jgi:cytosine/adenosine deaminase-related metal-dependent hydrolase
VLVTMDGVRSEIAGGGLYAEDGWIVQVGATAELPALADRVVNAAGRVVTPGLVNTHHHLYQTLTRAVPGAQDAGLFDWLRTLYPMWARMTPEHVSSATKVGLAELAVTGCTTAFDHQYLWPNGSSIDDQVTAAAEIGLRFHASRGSMSLGESDGGLPPDSVVEDEDVIIADTDRAIAAHHDHRPGAMTRIVVAPCSPFSVTPDLMRESIELARTHGVAAHTHLAETSDEERFCVDRFGQRPVPYAAGLGWEGRDVFYAHGVHVSAAEIEEMADAGTGVAHCPTSNMRLASGIAPLTAYLAHGVRVGFGVDGSASNDGSNMLAEARQAMLLARLAAAETGDPQLPARSALELATVGGAAVLGREDIGSLEPGKVCDVALWDTERIEMAGSLHDAVAALVLCAPGRVDSLFVHGRQVVAEGRLVTADEHTLASDHNRLAAQLFLP